MKYPEIVEFADVLQRRAEFDTIIDVRSEAEFAEDHIAGAINCPVLDNQQRIVVGTMYKQTGSFEAKRLGAALVARNIAQHIETRFLDRPRDWKPLIYCWRGGNRSGAMAHIFARIGWPVAQLNGGYKAYRQHVNHSLMNEIARFQWRVLCGPTGSGKSHLLRSLAAAGAQVLDLEDMAAHRGSVLGSIPDCPQPAQKQFESRIFWQLQQFHPQQLIFVEAESKKIGDIRVPELLMDTIRKAPCIAVQMTIEKRVDLLMQEYAHFILSPASLNQQLDFLTSLYGKEKIAAWRQLATTGELALLVKNLLEQHYDPAYAKSVRRNFAGAATATVIQQHDITESDFTDSARQILDNIA
ncbi:tRNA 2-selenouridine(34) synthase MnmH [Undibacterium sp. Di26W]|uniref:tRNA 2-selenouridine(34) synthase MnmH n=1 Tax=Undibacterium sp. Di26W TaxID=3413035 RepID=UPI003BF01533